MEPLRLPPPPFWRTAYWERIARHRPDRSGISDSAIVAAIATPYRVETQADGRQRRWYFDVEAHRWLRVVLLDDSETVHDAMYDRSFRP